MAYAEVRETHSAVVLLVGETVLKLKKPVNLGFLDYTTREGRLAALRNELLLNRRLAPDVYLSVSDLDDGEGRPVDHVLVMRRLPDDRRLGHLVQSGADVRSGLRAVAEQVASFHQRCERGPTIDRDGSRDALADRWRRNLERMREVSTHAEPMSDIETEVDAYLRGRGPLFEARIDARAIVDGHGDLLADDIFLMEDGPRILDCLEFDDRLRHVDCLDDIASLAMDLERLGGSEPAHVFVEAYRAAANEQGPESLLHHFTAYRAVVRAMVSAQPGAADPSSAGALVGLAQRHLRMGRVRLVLVGGSPGTGKTTVARAMGAEFGWRVIRSDEVRKTLAGVATTEPAAASFGQGIYTAEWNARTYDEVLAQARHLLGLGESVILDATWASAEARSQAAAVARTTSSDLVNVRCDAPLEVASERIRRRRRDASDADVEVAAQVRGRFDDWDEARVLDTTRPQPKLLEELRQRLDVG